MSRERGLAERRYVRKNENMEGSKTLQFLFCRLTQVDCNDIAETAVLLNSETRTHNTMVSVINIARIANAFQVTL